MPGQSRYMETYTEQKRNARFCITQQLDAGKLSHAQEAQFISSTLIIYALVFNKQLWPLLLTWFNFNPSMDK